MKRRDWDRTIDALNRSATGRRTIQMGSPGSAQVTRVRLLAQWNGLEATTLGDKLRLVVR
jgi:hypothetical protein